jgi:hypothetical protein
VANLDLTMPAFITHPQKHKSHRFSEITYPLVDISVIKHAVLFECHSDDLNDCLCYLLSEVGFTCYSGFHKSPVAI